MTPCPALPGMAALRPPAAAGCRSPRKTGRVFLMPGLGLGTSLAATLTRSTQAATAIPAGRLVIYILATGAAGVLASIGPARRAARLDVLTAIAAE